MVHFFVLCFFNVLFWILCIFWISIIFQMYSHQAMLFYLIDSFLYCKALLSFIIIYLSVGGFTACATRVPFRKLCLWLCDLAKTILYWIGVEGMKIFIIFRILEGNLWSSSFDMMLAIDLPHLAFTMLRHVLSIPCFSINIIKRDIRFYQRPLCVF